MVPKYTSHKPSVKKSVYFFFLFKEGVENSARLYGGLSLFKYSSVVVAKMLYLLIYFTFK